MKINNFKLRFRNVERSLQKLLAIKALCNETDAKLIDIKIKNAQQKKNDLILEMRNALFSSKNKKLNDFMTFNKPEVVLFKGNYYDKSKSEYFWQFVLSRIQIFFLQGKASLNMNEDQAKSFIESKFYDTFISIMKDKFGIEVIQSSCMVRKDSGFAAFYTVFNF